MNKSAIKGFSIRARRKLIEDITQKAFTLGIKDTKEFEEIEEFEGGFRVKNAKTQIVYPKEFKSHREKLISEISRKGFEQVIEEVAYTWFNRIIAIRFMEVNEYLPIKIRILSSERDGKVEPDILTNVYDYIDDLELDKEKVFELKESHKDEELFKYIFTRECNKLGALMPQVFEIINDFTELLLPDQLLSSGSVIRDMIESIEEDDFKEEVEIIGWIYQYYISERKEIVDRNVSKGKKVKKEDLPAKTQLFTPKWIVKYMVDNTVGRICHESSLVDISALKLDYYIKTSKNKNDSITTFGTDTDLLKLKILDPAMGSGHIIVYAFDLLYEIYLSKGFASRDIPRLIIENNLFGIDIDDRATQLASFALIMKARSKSRRFLKELEYSKLKMNIISIQDCTKYPKSVIHHIVDASKMKFNKEWVKDTYDQLVKVFTQAKELGTLVEICDDDYSEVLKITEKLSRESMIGDFEYLISILKQAIILNDNYDVIVTNPPYLGHRSMSPVLSNFAKKNYKNCKRDLSAMFIERCIKFAKENSLIAMINQHSWMFLDSYKKLRANMLDSTTIVNLIHLGAGAFEEISGEVVQSVSFVIRKKQSFDYFGYYYDLRSYNNHIDKENGFFESIDNNAQFEVKISDLFKIPDYPIAYWVSEEFRRKFIELKTLGDKGTSKQGLITANNDRFLRFWFEVDFSKIGFNFDSEEMAAETDYKWFPYIKGGEVRPWYGNIEYIVNYYDNGQEIKSYADENGKIKSRPQNTSYYFKSGITWSDVSTSPFYARYVPQGFIFDASGPMYFCSENNIEYSLGYMNTCVFKDFLKLISPGLHYGTGHIPKVPFISCENQATKVEDITLTSIRLMKTLWEDQEISWEFKKSPLLDFEGELIENRIREYRLNRLDIAERLVNLENELSNIFDDQSCLGYDYKSLVPSDEESVKNLISYAVGYIFGRYTLKEEYLISSSSDPKTEGKHCLSKDNILLVTEDEYRNDDIVSKFKQFLSSVFSENTLKKNIDYIASVLNPTSDKTPNDSIRSYFVKDFYKDHLAKYRRDRFKKPRPIYWMVESGKKNGVKALFYMHRYDKSTIARFRTDYLHEIQRAYENDIELTVNSTDGNAKKKVDDLKKKLLEVNEFDKVVAHIAHQQIEIDLDDGVEHNYELFQGIEVPQGDGQKPIKANLLAKRK